MNEFEFEFELIDPVFWWGVHSTLKIFGSRAPNLELPNSDLDLVISLPSVHKVSIVDSPGILEGVNAADKGSWQVRE